jgi:hypothetical protein
MIKLQISLPRLFQSQDFSTLEEYFEAGTVFDFTFGTSTTGATKKAGTAYVKSYTETGGATDDAKFDVTFTVTGPVTYTTNL